MSYFWRALMLIACIYGILNLHWILGIILGIFTFIVVLTIWEDIGGHFLMKEIKLNISYYMNWVMFSD